jgi:hypothetical protein
MEIPLKKEYKKNPRHICTFWIPGAGSSHAGALYHGVFADLLNLKVLLIQLRSGHMWE